MSISLLQEKRNKLMADSGVILADEASTPEQLASADTMMTEATGLEKRIASLKSIEAHEREQREFVPAERPTANQTADEQRTRTAAALRSFMQTSRVASEYRDVLTTSSSGAAVIPQLFNPELVTAMREFAPILSIVDTLGNSSNIAGLIASAGAGAETITAATVGYPDIAALYGSVTAAYARNGSWQMSTATRAYLMGLTATTGTPIFDANPAGNPFTTIFGRPVVINDSLPAIATGNKAILFGDFKLGYLLRTDGDPTIKRLDERFADTDEVGFIIRTRVGGVSKNAGISPFNALLIR